MAFPAHLDSTQRRPFLGHRADTFEASRGLAKDALAEFMRRNSRAGEWQPDQVEPTLRGGSPPPRRRSSAGHRSKPRLDSGDSSPMSADVAPPLNAVITVTDAQLRQAFGPSPIFGASPVSDEPPHPPSPKREDSGDAAEAAELEAMKKLTMDQMLTVFKGSPLPAATTPAPRPVIQFDDSPWSRPVVANQLDTWPSLPIGPAHPRSDP